MDTGNGEHTGQIHGPHKVFNIVERAPMCTPAQEYWNLVKGTARPLISFTRRHTSRDFHFHSVNRGFMVLVAQPG